METYSIPTSQQQYDEGAGLAYSEMNRTYKLRTFITNPLIWNVLGDLTGKSIVDLACGDGAYLKDMLDRGAKELVGIDISPEMIDTAKKQLDKVITLMVNDMSTPSLHLSIRENRFDLVLCAWGLYNMDTDEQLERALKNAHKMLVPGGKACFILAEDHKICANDIGKIIDLEVKNVLKGDWSGPTVLQKLLGKTFEVVDTWRPYFMYEEMAKKLGFTRIEKVDALFNEEGLKGWSPENWKKIKITKPIYAIVAYK